MNNIVSISEPKLSLTSKNYQHRKYKILEVINSLPADTSKEIKQNLPEILEVNRMTLSRWLNASIDSQIEIPSIKLALIAHVLDSPIEKLINIPINTKKINKQNIQTSVSITSKLGLVI